MRYCKGLHMFSTAHEDGVQQAKDYCRNAGLTMTEASIVSDGKTVTVILKRDVEFNQEGKAIKPEPITTVEVL